MPPRRTRRARGPVLGDASTAAAWQYTSSASARCPMTSRADHSPRPGAPLQVVVAARRWSRTRGPGPWPATCSTHVGMLGRRAYPTARQTHVDPGPLRDALTLVAGVVTGVLSAAFGVGGAVISTPAIRLLGAPAALAVGTTLPSILPSAVAGTIRYSKRGPDPLAGRGVDGAGGAGVGGRRLAAVQGGPRRRPLADDPDCAAARFHRGRAWPAAATGPRPPRTPRPPTAAPARPARRGRGGGADVRPARHRRRRGDGARASPSWWASRCKHRDRHLAGVRRHLRHPGTITHALLGDIDWRFALLLAVG